MFGHVDVNFDMFELRSSAHTRGHKAQYK